MLLPIISESESYVLTGLALFALLNWNPWRHHATEPGCNCLGRGANAPVGQRNWELLGQSAPLTKSVNPAAFAQTQKI
jgi:hypothetical protein